MFYYFYMETKYDFAGNLERELAEKDISPAELSRRTKLNKSAISKILNRETLPDRMFPSTLRAIANALNLPERTVFEWAGWLPPDPPDNFAKQEMNFWFEKLSEEDQAKMILFAKAIAEPKLKWRTQPSEE